MTTATGILALIAAALYVTALRRRDGSHRAGVRLGLQTLGRTAFLLLVAFVIVGFVEVLVPADLVRAWIGPESGARGLGLGVVAGILLPGGPYVVFPLVGSIYRSGAGLAPIVAVVTSWAMLGFNSLLFELSFMGWRFSAVRWGLSLGIPLLAGLLAELVFRPGVAGY